MRGTSEIVGMTGQQKVDLLAEEATKMVEGRYEATLALASLARSQAWRDLGFASIQDLAAEKTTLEAWEVNQMLWVGKALLEHPELDVAFRNGVLSWSKVKALVAHVTRDNVAGWIKKARSMSSNQLEHEIAKLRDPIVGERMVPMYVSEHALAWFQELLARKQAQKGEKNLHGGEFFYRMLDLMQAQMDDPAMALSAMGPVLPVPHSPDRSRHIPALIQKAALRRARFRCERCGNRLGIVFHHSVIPFAEGGPHTLANIEVCCGLCHDQAHDEERRAQLRKAPACKAVNGGGVAALDQLPAEEAAARAETAEGAAAPALPPTPATTPGEVVREAAARAEKAEGTAPALPPPPAPTPVDVVKDAAAVGDQDADGGAERPLAFPRPAVGCSRAAEEDDLIAAVRSTSTWSPSRQARA